MGIPPTIELSTLGMPDTLLLMVLALVLFGPRRLPEIGRQIGKLMYEFRKASNDFKFQMEEELRNAEDADRLKKEDERQQTLALAAPTEPAQTIDAVAATAEETATESPYPGEDVYPALTEPTSESPAEETYPGIQPPSTGEQVPAARPGSQGAEPSDASAAAAEPDTSAATSELTAEGNTDKTIPDTEQAVQNG
jgi:sec-independent protein translocase protein TatB